MSRLLRLYPRAWRTRYGAELASILEARPPRLMDRVDLVLGALDAHLHPELVDTEAASIPLGHRLPGLLAIAGGMAWAGAYIAGGITGSDGWLQGIGIAFLLMLVSLPGTYMSAVARPIGAAIAGLIGAVILVTVLPWGANFIPMVLILVLLGAGTLALASYRAGVGSTARRLIVGIGFGVPAVMLVLISMGVGFQMDQGLAPQAFIIAGYGVVWAGVGLLMLRRGSPTFRPRIDTGGTGS